MSKKQFFSNWMNFKTVSFGLVTTLFFLWLIFHTGNYVPEGKTDYWTTVFLSYGVLLSVIFGVSDVRNKLFNLSFFKSLPRFFLFLIPSLFIFYFMFSFVNPLSESFFEVVSSVPIWLALIHAFVFATIESAIWQGFLDSRLGRVFSPLTAGFFHWGIWSGDSFLVIISASLLFMFFSWVHWYFRKNKSDLVPVIAVHTAFNIIKLGLMSLG